MIRWKKSLFVQHTWRERDDPISSMESELSDPKIRRSIVYTEQRKGKELLVNASIRHVIVTSVYASLILINFYSRSFGDDSFRPGYYPLFLTDLS